MASEAIEWLPDTKFAFARFGSNASISGDEEPNHEKVGRVKFSREKQNFPFFLDTPRRTATDRLAEDRIGKELAPDATIWELYEEETKDFDDELVNGRNQNLDMLLLFAGLFSAVVTGFLVESASLLQQDPADASLALLLYIAQSQQRLESGNPQSTSTLVEIPSFTSPQYARWINGLWFLSLALSLCTALVAMLAKEWLTAFISARPRSPYVHALIHQQRLKALDRWYALHIIDFLPTLLHFALLLFSIGLVIYLWTLDYAIAVAIAVVVAATALFYGVTAILPSIYRFCPFVTQVSKYVRGTFTANRTSAEWIEHTLSKIHTASFEVLEALRWLSENAQDPTTGACSYQALAGMRTSSTRTDNLSLSTRSVDDGPSNKPIVPVQESKLLVEMLQTICQRIPPTLVSENGVLSDSQGMAVSRYTMALPKLLVYLGTGSIQQAQIYNAKQSNDAHTAQEPPAKLAFSTLEHIWSNGQPHLPGDAYAMLTAAELHLIEVIASGYRLDQPDSTASQPPLPLPDGKVNSCAQVELNMGRAQDDTNSGIIPLFELRARCSQALFRAAMVIQYREAGNVFMRADVLVYLLESIQLVFQCPSLNPKAPVTTHQPQSAGEDTLPKFMSHVVGAGTYRFLYPFDIGDEDGLLTGLIKTLGFDDSTELPGLAQTTRVTLATVAPVLLRQWLNMNLKREVEHPRLMDALGDLQTHWPNRPRDRSHALHLQRQGTWGMNQLIVIALVASSCLKYEGVGPLVKNTLQKLCQLTNMGPSGKTCAADAATLSYHLITKLIRNLCAYEELDLHALSFGVQWLLTPLQHMTAVNLVQDARRDSVWDPDDDIYQILLRVWAQTPGLESELERFLDDMFRGPMDDVIECLWGSDGLSNLAAIGQHRQYAPLIAEPVARMTTSLLEQDYGAVYWEITDHKSALPHFLQVAGLSLDHTPPSSPSYHMLSRSFVCAASVVRSDLQGSLTTAGFGPYNGTFFRMTRSVLLKLNEAPPEVNELLSEYEEILGLAEDPEAWMYGILHWLFENIDLSQGDEEAER